MLQRAVLASRVFEKIFDTFHGDTVSKAQIAKRAREVGVHPESADECAQVFIDSAVTAELGTLSGENIALINARSMAATSAESLTAQNAEQFEEHPEEQTSRKDLFPTIVLMRNDAARRPHLKTPLR